MLSKKSYFKPALFWDDLRRFSPIWVCASLVLMLFPFITWMRYQDFLRDTNNSGIGAYSYYSGGYNLDAVNNLASMRLDINEFLLDILCEIGPIAIMLYALLPAMALLHYLYQSRSALGIHALPISRGALFVTHYVAGLAMMVLPLLIFCVVSIPVLMYASALWLPVLLMFCAVCFGIYLFFFSFAFFCGMFTGQLWGVPLFYAIFNAVATITYACFMMLAQQFLFGFSTSALDETVVRGLTPIWQIMDSLYLKSITTEGTFSVQGLDTVLCYAIIGLCLSFAAYCIFRLRHLERAGEIVSVRVMRPIFTTCLGVYGGFCALMLYSYIFNSIETGWMFFFLLLGCVFGFAIGQMLLEKTIAIFSVRNAKHLVFVMALSCLCLATIRFDLLGYAPYIPEADDIESVSISTSIYADNLSFYDYNDNPFFIATDEDDINLLRSAHAALLADYATTGERYPGETDTAPTVEVIEPEPATHEENTGALNLGAYTYYDRATYIDFAYTLKTGQVVTRSYYLSVNESELSREGSPLSYLEAYVSGIDLKEMLESYRDQMHVSYYLYGVDDGFDSASAEKGSKTADAALDAMLVDLSVNGSKLSLMSKAYETDRIGNINFDIYRTETNHKNDLIYVNDGCFSLDLYPGTNAVAFVENTLAALQAEKAPESEKQAIDEMVTEVAGG